MKRLLSLLGWLSLIAALHGQPTPASAIIAVPTAPSGSCAGLPDRQTPDGAIYRCKSGTWSGDGGGVAAIGGTVSGGNDCAVLFVHPAGVLSQDTTNGLCWNDVNKTLLTGTSASVNGTKLQVVDSNVSAFLGALGVNSSHTTTGDPGSSLVLSHTVTGTFNVSGVSAAANSVMNLNVSGNIGSVGNPVSALRGDVEVNFAGGAVTNTYIAGSYNDVQISGGTNTWIAGSWSWLGLYAGTISNAADFYAQAPSGGTIPAAVFSYYSEAIGGIGTNSFPLWFDEQGVADYHSINTFNGVYQARSTLYNPQVTKFTPGAVNFERCIPGCQWESNIAVITNEAGGTGVLRPLRLGDAGSSIITQPLNYIATETGANNAIAGTLTGGPALVAGLAVSVLLAHSLQAGANTFNYNAGGAVNIRSHRNTANNIGTAYTSGIIDLIYDGTQWEDRSQ